MGRNRKLAVNISTNAIYLILNYTVTFFLASYLTKKLGEESYGFIGMCNNIVNYSQIITLALNGVAGRFIALEMHRGHKEEAGQYFSSTFYSNLVMAIGLSLIFVPICLYMDQIFEIPAGLVQSVKLLFFLSYLNMSVSILQTVFNVSTFITNNMYLTNIANIVGMASRLFLLLVLFGNWGANLAFVGIATLSATGIVCVFHIVYTKKLLPDLKIQSRFFSLSKIKELFLSGMWNSFIRLSQVLADGLDLIISNIFISALAMSQLSLAYVISGFVASAYGILSNSFNPILTEIYAKDDMQDFKREMKFFMKISGLLGIIIFWGLLYCGHDFYDLWIPDSDIDKIYGLMVLSSISVMVSCVISPLYATYTITNKLRFYGVVCMFVSVFDIIVELVLLQTTDLGVYAVAGVSKIVSLGVNFFFIPMYASYCLRFRYREFYPTIGRYFVASFGTGAVLWFVNKAVFSVNSWAGFAVKVMMFGGIGAVCGIILILNQNEMSKLWRKSGQVFKRWRKNA